MGGITMKKSLNIIIYIIIAFIALMVITSLVWGKTLKMAKANRLLLTAKPKQAQAIYEQLAASSPHSPYILHNLGLAFYKQALYDKAIANLSNALQIIENPQFSVSGSTRNTLLNRMGYNLGNAFFKQAEKSSALQNGSDNNNYQSALANYQKAIGANSSDLAAKYNYELTKLRLQQEQNNQSQQNQKNQQDQKQQQNKPKQNNNGSNKSDPSSKGQSNNSSSSGSQNGQMTKEEAEALLQMMKNQDQSKAPMVGVHRPGKDALPKEDW